MNQDQLGPLITLILVAITGVAFGLRDILKFRFGLRDMLISVIVGAACVSMIVASKDPLVITLGVFGLILLVAFIISAIGRANIESEDPEAPPHGSDPE